MICEKCKGKDRTWVYLVVIVVLLVLFMLGCSGQTTPEPDAPQEPTGPAAKTVYYLADYDVLANLTNYTNSSKLDCWEVPMSNCMTANANMACMKLPHENCVAKNQIKANEDCIVCGIEKNERANYERCMACTSLKLNVARK